MKNLFLLVVCSLFCYSYQLLAAETNKKVDSAIKLIDNGHHKLDYGLLARDSKHDIGYINLFASLLTIDKSSAQDGFSNDVTLGIGYNHYYLFTEHSKNDFAIARADQIYTSLSGLHKYKDLEFRALMGAGYETQRGKLIVMVDLSTSLNYWDKRAVTAGIVIRPDFNMADLHIDLVDDKDIFGSQAIRFISFGAGFSHITAFKTSVGRLYLQAEILNAMSLRVSQNTASFHLVLPLRPIFN